MQWGSVSEFFAMGGYGVYVWGSFGLTALALAAEVWLVRRRQRQAALAIKGERAQDRSG